MLRNTIHSVGTSKYVTAKLNVDLFATVSIVSILDIESVIVSGMDMQSTRRDFQAIRPGSDPSREDSNSSRPTKKIKPTLLKLCKWISSKPTWHPSQGDFYCIQDQGSLFKRDCLFPVW
eukprot:TRINITY_DN22716_c0_g2_i1.p1 TRINITY_DN22716_c0_g2~~TRINITY_DN22716_c0_g2_i1.p1  ORF type:complete len:119 (+),score=11.41 TRINITY_DN22716_c0_g2_i1:143-499(+)